MSRRPSPPEDPRRDLIGAWQPPQLRFVRRDPLHRRSTKRRDGVHDRDRNGHVHRERDPIRRSARAPRPGGIEVARTARRCSDRLACRAARGGQELPRRDRSRVSGAPQPGLRAAAGRAGRPTSHRQDGLPRVQHGPPRCGKRPRLYSPPRVESAALPHSSRRPGRSQDHFRRNAGASSSTIGVKHRGPADSLSHRMQAPGSATGGSYFPLNASVPHSPA